MLGLWEWAGRVPVSIAFPTFTDTLAAFVDMLADGTFASAYAETLGPLLVGVGLTAVGGVLAGVVMGLSPRAQWFGLPVFIVLQASPSAAIIPLITFVYGIGFAAKVFAVVLLSAAGDRAQLLPRGRQRPPVPDRDGRRLPGEPAPAGVEDRPSRPPAA